jgi:hypothetical protein
MLTPPGCSQRSLQVGFLIGRTGANQEPSNADQRITSGLPRPDTALRNIGTGANTQKGAGLNYVPFRSEPADKQ